MRSIKNYALLLSICLGIGLLRRTRNDSLKTDNAITTVRNVYVRGNRVINGSLPFVLV